MTRQIDFAIVESPSIVGFREQLARTGKPPPDPGGADSRHHPSAPRTKGFHRWLPIRAGEADCVAPIRTGPGQG